MRIHYLGNNGTDYSYARYMNRAGYDAWFYTDYKVHPRIAIGYVHNILSDEDVQKIKFVDMLSTSPMSLGAQACDILQQVSNCDVMQCNGLYGFWALLAGKPSVYKPFGGDVNHWPFLDDTEEERIRAWYIRRILKESTVLLGLAHQKKFLKALKALDISLDRVRGWCFPMNADVYAPMLMDDLSVFIKENESQDRFIILNSSQLMIEPSRALQYTKGTDFLLKAVERFAHTVGPDKIALWLVDRGPQRKECRRMVSDLGLDPLTRWFPPQAREGLVRLYNCADIVFDQIDPEIANNGYTTVEAMACCKPVLCYIDHDHRENIAKEPPIPNVNVCNEPTIYDALMRLYTDPDERVRIGQAGREFVLEHHHWENACHAYADILQEAIARHAASKSL